mgnify:CR=1 FL=1
MSSDKTRTLAEDEAPKEVEQDGPLTKEVFVAKVHELTERARAAGLNPLRLLVQAYRKRGTAILAGLLDSLGNEDVPKKKRKRK